MLLGNEYYQGDVLPKNPADLIRVVFANREGSSSSKCFVRKRNLLRLIWRVDLVRTSQWL